MFEKFYMGSFCQGVQNELFLGKCVIWFWEEKQLKYYILLHNVYMYIYNRIVDILWQQNLYTENDLES